MAKFPSDQRVVWLVGIGGLPGGLNLVHGSLPNWTETTDSLMISYVASQLKHEEPLPAARFRLWPKLELDCASTFPRTHLTLWVRGRRCRGWAERVFPSADGERSCLLYFPMFHLACSLLGLFFIFLFFICHFFKSRVWSQMGDRSILKLSCKMLYPSQGEKLTRGGVVYVFQEGGGGEML